MIRRYRHAGFGRCPTTRRDETRGTLHSTSQVECVAWSRSQTDVLVVNTLLAVGVRVRSILQLLQLALQALDARRGRRVVDGASHLFSFTLHG